MSTDPLVRVAQQRHLIARLGLAVAFEALLILALLAFFFMNRRYEALGAENAMPAKNENPIVKAEPVAYTPEPGGPDGKQIFETRCNSCHRADAVDGAAPGLAGALERIPKGDWLYRWVRKPEEMVKTDPYAKQLFAKYKTTMTAQPLSDEEIDAVFHYVDAYNGKK